MKIESEIKELKKEISFLNSKFKKINITTEHLKKLIFEKRGIENEKKFRRKINYINRLDNERRMRNIMSPD